MEEEKLNGLVYQDNEIHYSFAKNENVMVNATEMAKVFGKRTDHFLKTDNVKEFIAELERPPFGGTSKLKVTENRGHMGIYFERRLALKFAAWLDVKFEVWVFSKIDEILFGKAKLVSKTISDEEKKKLEISILIDKVKKIGNDDVNQLLNELDELKKIKNNKRKAMLQFSNQYKMWQ